MGLRYRSVNQVIYRRTNILVTPMLGPRFFCTTCIIIDTLTHQKLTGLNKNMMKNYLLYSIEHSPKPQFFHCFVVLLISKPTIVSSF